MIGDAGAEIYWTEPLSWDDFSAAFLERARLIAERYKPEYYVIVDEPVWYAGMDWTRPGGMLTETVSVDQWVRLTEVLCETVRKVSPSTELGVAIALPYSESQNYILRADSLKNVDFVGIDIFNLDHFEVIDGFVDALKKPKWILQTWDGIPDRHRGIGWRTESAATWLRVVDNYAKSRGFVGVVTFFNLWLCQDYASPRPRSFQDVRQRLDERQPAFYVLQELALQADSPRASNE
jgi:hypothetical protein